MPNLIKPIKTHRFRGDTLVINIKSSSRVTFLSLFPRLLGRMSVRGLDPTCPSTIKREPSSPSPSSQGDISPAQPSPGSSSSDTNSSYGQLIKSHNHSNGLDSPGLYGHAAGLANNVGTNRLVAVHPVSQINNK